MIDDEHAIPNQNEGETADQAYENQSEKVDWKAAAIRAQTELEIARRQPDQGRPAAEPQQSETDKLAQKVEQLRSTMPVVDQTKPQTWWEREQHKEQLDIAREQLSEARERDRQRTLQNMQYQTQSQKVVQDVKGQFRSRAAFAQVEQKFDQMVSQLRPEVQANPQTLTVMMKNLLFDAGETGGPQAPPKPGGAYGSRGPGAQPAKGGKNAPVEFKSDIEAEIATHYGMSAEEYYSAKYNERGPETSGNGVSIYPFKIGGRT